MSLNVQVLIDELRSFGDSSYLGFSSFPNSPIAAQQAWTSAYNTYASTAQDVSGDLLLTANAIGFTSALNFTPSNSKTLAASVLEFDLAFVSYWTGAVFAVGIPPAPGGPCSNIFSPPGNGIFGLEATSIVSVVTPGVLSSKLLDVMVNPKKDAVEQIELIAQAFHEATTTAIKVLIVGTDTIPPPAGPYPVTNLCEIH
jgi:hypothetical protein